MFALEIFSLRAYVLIVYAGDAIPFNPTSFGTSHGHNNCCPSSFANLWRHSYQKHNISFITLELQSGEINFHLTLSAIAAIIFHQPFI